MKPEAAIKLIHEMRRYKQHRGLAKRGNLILQLLIPKATAREVRLATAIADRRYARYTTTELVRVDKLVSEQSALGRRNMVYHLRRYAALQKCKRPLVIPLPGGKRFIWDGNHRCTTAILLDKSHLRCDVMRRKTSA